MMGAGSSSRRSSARLARDRHQRVHEVREHFAEHPGQHAAERQADAPADARDLQPFVTRWCCATATSCSRYRGNFAREPSLGSAGAGEADDVGDDEEVLRRIEPARPGRQFAGERGLEPCLAGAGWCSWISSDASTMRPAASVRRAERDVCCRSSAGALRPEATNDEIRGEIGHWFPWYVGADSVVRMQAVHRLTRVMRAAGIISERAT